MSFKKTKLINGFSHILFPFCPFSEEEMLRKSTDFLNIMNSRRSIREFSDISVSKEIIKNIIKTASTAPSGANKQPWTFCVVSNPEIKQKIRFAAEVEEQESYKTRMSDRWKNDLKHLGTDANKPFLEEAPYLIIVFKKAYDLNQNNKKTTNYYVNESVGIACGMLITAIHQAGLVTLTHTPSPMNFLTKILKRPKNERPFLLLPVGYPKNPVYVPDIKRKKIDEIAVFYE